MEQERKVAGVKGGGGGVGLIVLLRFGEGIDWKIINLQSPIPLS